MKSPESMATAFYSMFRDFQKKQEKTKKALSGNDEQVVRKCVAALDGSDHALAEAAAEKLGSMGKKLCLPGILKALQLEDYSKYVLHGLSQAHYDGDPEPGWRESVYPLLMLCATSQHPDASVSRQAGILAVTLNPSEATQGILEATAFPEGATLIDIHQTTRFNLPDDVLSLLGAALLPHGDDLRLGPFLDTIVTRLAAANWQGGPPELGSRITEERARQESRALGMRTATQTFLRLEKSGQPNNRKICALHQSLDDRFHRKGIEVGFNYDRAEELKHMTRQEWVIRTLNCWVVGLENSGNLREDCATGLQLLQELEEVGLPGCIRALQAIAVLQDEEQKVYEREEAGELSEDEAGDEVARLLEAMEKAEFDAEPESWEECATALWTYAVKHQIQILVEV